MMTSSGSSLTLIGFLKESYQKMTSDEGRNWIVVSGSEACDLDSVACAIAYGYFKQHLDPDVTVIPICNLNRNDLRLRTEITFWLGQCGLSSSNLIFLDDLFGSHSKFNRNSVKLVLVDHHSPTGKLLNSQWPLAEVIDHHPTHRNLSTELKHCRLVQVELVGSCSTLIVAQILENDYGHMPPNLWKLLYGALLIDTVGLSESGRKAARLTDLDLWMGTRIEDIICEQLFTDGQSRESIFDAIDEAKCDITGLSTLDLLSRDFKVAFGKDDLKIVCPTVFGCDFEFLIGSTDFISAANQLCVDNFASLLVCITVGQPPVKTSTGAIRQHPSTTTTTTRSRLSLTERRRSVIVYSPQPLPELCEQLVSFLCSPSNSLHIQPSVGQFDNIYFVGLLCDLRVTRKAIMYTLMKFLEPPCSMNKSNSVTAGESVSSDDTVSGVVVRDDDPTMHRTTSFDLPMNQTGHILDITRNNLDQLRGWLLNMGSKERFKLVQDCAQSSLDKLDSNIDDAYILPGYLPCSPTVDVFRRITAELLYRFNSETRTNEDDNKDSFDSSLPSFNTSKKMSPYSTKALALGRRSTLPETSIIHCSQSKARARRRQSSFGVGVRDYRLVLGDSLRDDVIKPEWLETEYLRANSSNVSAHLLSGSKDAVENVSFRLYRRLSTAPHLIKSSTSSISGIERGITEETLNNKRKNSKDAEESSSLDDAEMELLCASFGDIHSPNLQSPDPTNAYKRINSASTMFDRVVRRGINFARQKNKLRTRRSTLSECETVLPIRKHDDCSHSAHSSQVTFSLNQSNPSE